MEITHPVAYSCSDRQVGSALPWALTSDVREPRKRDVVIRFTQILPNVYAEYATDECSGSRLGNGLLVLR